jgi:hypothetical protein
MTAAVQVPSHARLQLTSADCNPHLCMRLNLDEGHIVDEEAGEQRDGRWRERKDFQKLDGVRLNE